MVQQICKDSGAEICISGDDDTPPSLSDRIVTIWGTVAEKDAACKEVMRITHRSQDLPQDEDGIFVLVVPDSSVPIIAGPAGATLDSLCKASGADVSISPKTIFGTNLQPISIAGDLGQTCSAAARICAILQHLADHGRLEGACFDPWRPPALGEAARRPPLDRGRKPPSASGARGVGSRSATPGRTTITGGASSRAASSTAPSRSATPSRSSPAVRLVVSARMAAWIVGRGGRTVASIRSGSGADVEVARSGGAARVVEVRGGPAARDKALGLLFEAMQSFPEGAPSELRLAPGAIAVATLLADGAAELQQLREAFGAEVDVLSGDGDGDGYVLRLAGDAEALLRTACRVSSRFADASVSEARPPLSTASATPAVARTPTSSIGEQAVAQAAAKLGRLAADYGRGGCPSMASGSCGGLGAGPQLGSEAQLLQSLLAGPQPGLAQLQLALPLDLVRGPLLVGGKLQAIAQRSGSKLELGVVHSPPATQLLTVTGSMLGNSMAALYIQEVMLQFGFATR